MPCRKGAAGYLRLIHIATQQPQIATGSDNQLSHSMITSQQALNYYNENFYFCNIFVHNKTPLCGNQFSELLYHLVVVYERSLLHILQLISLILLKMLVSTFRTVLQGYHK